MAPQRRNQPLQYYPIHFSLSGVLCQVE